MSDGLIYTNNTTVINSKNLNEFDLDTIYVLVSNGTDQRFIKLSSFIDDSFISLFGVSSDQSAANGNDTYGSLKFDCPWADFINNYNSSGSTREDYDKMSANYYKHDVERNIESHALTLTNNGVSIEVDTDYDNNTSITRQLLGDGTTCSIDLKYATLTIDSTGKSTLSYNSDADLSVVHANQIFIE